MRSDATLAVITYWTLIVIAYIWMGVQVFVGEPFDAMVLFMVTFSFQSYRRAVSEEAGK